MWNRTYYPKAADHLNVEKKWFIIDASNKRLGRLACAVANVIRGKDQPTYTPSVDMGAYVIVVRHIPLYNPGTRTPLARAGSREAMQVGKT